MLKKKSKKFMGVTIIASGTTINGSLESDSILEVYGTIRASKNSPAIESTSSVRVADGAEVVGDIHCIDLDVEGFVDGNIYASGSVKLRQGSTVLGNVESSSLTVEDGVSFNGGVRMRKAEYNHSQEEDASITESEE